MTQISILKRCGLGAPFAAAFMTLMGITQTTQGELLVYEGFDVPGDYTNGAAIDGGTGGSGWTGGWAQPGTFVTQTGSLAPAGLQSSGGVMHRTDAVDDGVSTTIGREYGSLFSDTDEAWFSFGFSRDESRGMSINPIDNTTSSSSGQFFGINVGNSNDLYARIRYGSSSSIAVSDDTYTLVNNTNYFVIGQVLINPSGVADDELRVWIFEADTLDLNTLSLGAPTLSVSYDVATAGSAYDSWSLGVTQPANPTYDEFRLGDTLADVTPLIPEPAPIALLGLGGLVLLARRRGK